MCQRMCEPTPTPTSDNHEDWACAYSNGMAIATPDSLEDILREHSDDDVVKPKPKTPAKRCSSCQIINRGSCFWESLYSRFRRGVSRAEMIRSLLSATMAVEHATGSINVSALGGDVIVTGKESPAYWEFVKSVITVTCVSEALYKACFVGNIELAACIGFRYKQHLPFGIEIMSVAETGQFLQLASALASGYISEAEIRSVDPRRRRAPLDVARMRSDKAAYEAHHMHIHIH